MGTFGTWSLFTKVNHGITYIQRVSAVFSVSGRTLSSLASPSSCVILGDQVTAENQHECLAQVMTPLWQVPYEEQLHIKYNWTKSVVKDIVTKFKAQCKDKHARKLTFPTIEQVQPSPVTEAYRNKDELHIRTGIDGDPKTLGFYVGSPAQGSVVCVPPTHLISAKQSHIDIAQAFQHYIQQSELAACHDFSDGGHWRGLLVRSTEAGQTMAIAVCHPQDLGEERLEEEREHLRDFFLHGEGKYCTPNSLYFQACRNTRCTHEEAPFMLLHGDEHLTEHLSGLALRISPDSFFQVNTRAAEVLYATVLRLAHTSPITTLLDVCCGTGTISLLASQQVRGAVGVEAVQDAVNDARYNAKINNICNVDFFVGLVEKKLRKVLNELDMASDIVAVVNPSRRGVAPKVIRMLSECPQIRRLVYVSCKADNPTTTANFVQLCVAGAFSLRRVVPVDMFPHTLHTELVLEFCRWEYDS